MKSKISTSADKELAKIEFGRLLKTYSLSMSGGPYLDNVHVHNNRSSDLRVDNLVYGAVSKAYTSAAASLLIYITKHSIVKKAA